MGIKILEGYTPVRNESFIVLGKTIHRMGRILSRFIVLLAVPCSVNVWAQEARVGFRAGAALVDISPPAYPVRVNGMFTERSAQQAVDPLHSRAIAVDDGEQKIVLCVVDTCMLPRDLIDNAKGIASRSCGLPTDHMMVSATHTHSAPAAMGCLGSRMDPAYATWLPDMIAESIVAATKNLRPAQAGWASVDDWAHTHNRRWIRRADRMFEDPYGGMTVRAHMHPGYESADVIGPSGPVDPELSVLAFRTIDGEPLALLANYSQHYFGSPLLSADYFGVFRQNLAERLEQDADGSFVAIMSQGTSGDLMWMDYGAPQKDITLDTYSDEMAAKAMEAYKQIDWRGQVPIAMVERKLRLNYRVPNAERLAWAQQRVDALDDALPTNKPDIYAYEALYLHERQSTEIVLQAIRIGGLTMATLPNEVYAITGLKLKAQAPLDMHFNLALANGAEGYIPPPEQFALGGYTTWEARTAGLEETAEPRIVETLLAALEEAAGAPRKAIDDTRGPYTKAVTAAKPIAYWRLNEIADRAVQNVVADGPTGTLTGGAALYLPGVGSGSGSGAEEVLRHSNFSGPHEINRAIHFADGTLDAQVSLEGDSHTVMFWFWLGEPSGASERTGTLYTSSAGAELAYTMAANGQARLSYRQVDDETPVIVGEIPLTLGEWHLAVLTQDDSVARVYVNGHAGPVIESPAVATERVTSIQFANGLEGKLDEIALFDRAIHAAEIVEQWDASGIAEERVQAEGNRRRAEREIAARANPPLFPESYGSAIDSLKPIVHASLAERPASLAAEPGVRFFPTAFAKLDAGRLRGSLPPDTDAYTVSLWFRNDKANNARPVTSYLFSRGPDANEEAPGDHLGIGGTYRSNLTGRLIVFNGNAADKVVAGKTIIPPETWNHVVFIRDGKKVSAYLNGVESPEIEADLAPTASHEPSFFLGARCDNFAPLQGYLAEFALFNRALSVDEAQQLHSASGQPVGAPKPLAVQPSQLESQPLSPEEALRSIHVPEGFAVDLVVAEPLVLDPVAFDWDARGRLWVVEMADYPLGMDGKGAAGGRIRILNDTDADGRYDTSTLFAEGLNFPTGILTWRDGAIVSAAPDIVFLRDTDGDNIADEKTTLLSGLSEGNQQLRANGLRWGLDNWVYVAAGGHHDKYALETKVRSPKIDEEIVIGSRDFRFKPDTGEVVPASGPTQFGRNRDDWGHWFGTQNSHPLWHYVLRDHYLQRNPFLPFPDSRVQVLGATNPPVYPASSIQKRFHTFLHSGHYTSACSGMIYRDARLFPRETINGFVCEPFHNLVQHIIMNRDGVSFTGTPSGANNQLDFFASEDRWCRPVTVRTGPDGNLWIADMYRYMIEHPQWLPEEGKQELLPFYREGDERGRIYRVRTESTQPAQLANLDTMSDEELLTQLGDANGWIRDKAQQLLLWRDARGLVPMLEKMADGNGSPHARLHALCTLDGLKELREDVLVALLDDLHPGIRENALRIAESYQSAEIQKACLARVDDDAPSVQLQLAFTLGSFPPAKEAGDALANLLVRHGSDMHIRLAALSSALPHQQHLIANLSAVDNGLPEAVRDALIEMAIAAKDPGSASTLVGAAFNRATQLPTSANFSTCVSILDLLKRRSTDPRNLGGGTAQSLDELFERAKSVCEDDTAMLHDRVAGAALLARATRERDYATNFLASSLDPLLPPEDLLLVLSTWALTGDERFAERLVPLWPQLSPSARHQVIDHLLSRQAWTNALIAAVSEQRISHSSLDQSQRMQLLNHPEESIRTKATKTLSPLASSRAQIVADYQPALDLKGDPDKGRAVYEEACMSCHKHGNDGTTIGPDFRTIISHPPEKILANILDPSADIQPGFHAYYCELKDWEQLYGVITSENAVSITLQLTNGEKRIILRSDIETLESTNQSLMPAGWEEIYSLQDIANLIAFIRTASD